MQSYSEKKISNEIKPVSNIINGEIRIPCLTILYAYRVVICTLHTSGCIVRARDDPLFDSNHFSHVFIDEAACTHETVALIPITGKCFLISVLSRSILQILLYFIFKIGLCTAPYKINSSIILAGDPKQLDAVTKSTFAADLGFKISLMEQLFKKRRYMRDPTTGEYDARYITQLVKNYRSHSAILEIPNRLYYENKLVAMAPTGN